MGSENLQFGFLCDIIRLPNNETARFVKMRGDTNETVRPEYFIQSGKF